MTIATVAKTTSFAFMVKEVVSIRGTRAQKRGLAAKGHIIEELWEEAGTAIADHPKTPEAWKRNIPAFLYNCYKHYPQVSRWAWAIRCFQMGWCHTAPFQYFKHLIMNPDKFRMAGSKAFYTPYQTIDWLKRTKGWRAAMSYGKRAGIIRTKAMRRVEEVQRKLADPVYMKALDQFKRSAEMRLEEQVKLIGEVLLRDAENLESDLATVFDQTRATGASRQQSEKDFEEWYYEDQRKKSIQIEDLKRLWGSTS